MATERTDIEERESDRVADRSTFASGVGESVAGKDAEAGDAQASSMQANAASDDRSQQDAEKASGNRSEPNGMDRGAGGSAGRGPSRPGDTPAVADSADDLAEARARLERMKFNAAKEELRRAELAFLSAKRVLPEGAQRIAAERIAEALRRCNLSVDSVQRGVAAHPAMEALEGVSKFDPVADLADFVLIGGRSLALAARDLARCGAASIEYWGRQLEKLAKDLADYD